MADKIKGLNALLKKLDNLDRDLTRKVGAVVAANALELAQKARFKAPIDDGFLRQSILAFENEDLSWRIVAGASYAAYQEFGTGGLVSVPQELKEIAIRFKGRGIKQINMKPQPFMYPALVEQRPKLLRDMTRLLEKEIGKI